VIVSRIDLAGEYRLEKLVNLDSRELRKRRHALADADGALSNRTGEREQARQLLAAARAALDGARAARARLETVSAAPAAEIDVATAKAALDLAQRRLRAWRQKHQADELRSEIGGNELVLQILAPDGLRATKLARVLEMFNSNLLAPLSDAAEWKRIVIDAQMTIAYGGRPYALLSTSEQYRVRAILQVAMAQLDDSAMVVLDAADVLDAPTRGGLVAMIEEAGLPALICLTLSRREQLPDLAAAGIGASMWLDDGVAQPLHEPAEAAA
jgi:hypothetical protein